MSEKEQIQISVRGLVEFLLRSGDIDNRSQGGSVESAMQEGSRIHRLIQAKMGPEYEAEVSLQYVMDTPRYVLLLEGRADGVITTEEGVTIDEIKGTYRKLNHMKSPVPEHLAQARCYAYMVGIQRNLPQVRIRITYCNMETEELRYFYEDMEWRELEEWFLDLMHEYRKWADFRYEWHAKRQKSLELVEFPFPYREGQKELATQVYQTIAGGKKLFLEAPTGVGKTITTVFPAVKAMGRGLGDKLFYFTAKTITRTVAEEAFSLLREQGMVFRSIVLTAKEKICFCDKTECNPENCPYAKGHFDRINSAIYDILISEEKLSRELIEAFAMKHQVCPFEFSLDVSLFADGIICDYNYLFDPEAYLKRFFAPGVTGDYLFLIDEAHNLLDRGREMYSAVLWKEEFMSLRRSIKQQIREELTHEVGKKQVEGQLSLFDAAVSEESDTLLASPLEEEEGMEKSVLSQPASFEDVEGTEDREDSALQLPAFFEDAEGEDSIYLTSKGGKRRKQGYSKLVREGYADKLIYHLEKCNKDLLELKRECPDAVEITEIDDFFKHLERLYGVFSDYLEEREEHQLPIRKEILDVFFDVRHFLNMAECMDENYVTYTQLQDDGSFFIKLFCTNPRVQLQECMKKGRSTILFSATLLPIQYYKKLLGGEAEDYEVYAKSVFDPSKRKLMIASDVTSKYKRRGIQEYQRIAAYISELFHARRGNYMVFCPSHVFLEEIYDCYMQEYALPGEECILQQDNMNEVDRENFLGSFTEDSSVLAFCVLGGIFSEGIDLKRDRLIGVAIVGTGIPQVCFEREVLRQHFDEEGEDGFDYAYRFPGMNKVLQAAGRVIRTAEDVGAVLLLDERFLQSAYRKMFPREWEGYAVVRQHQVHQQLMDFWVNI